MALIVEINPDTRAEFLDPTFNKFPGLEQQLIDEFIYCKEHNATTDIFGNDAVFTFPPYAVDAQLARATRRTTLATSHSRSAEEE